MMKMVVSIISFLLFSACSMEVKDSRSLFYAGAGSEFTVTGKQEAGDGIIWIEDTSDIHSPPVFELTGSLDLSENNRIKIVLINGSKRDNINASFKMESTDPLAAGSCLEAKKGLRGGDTVEWIIPIPASPANPAIVNKLSGMRATPFNIDGITSTIDPEKISRILVSFDKSLKGARLGIKEITVVKGESATAPRWFSMSEQEFFPFIDKYGQFMHKNWPGKTTSDSDLVADRRRELLEIENNPGPNDRSQYGGWLKGKRQEATGSFYVRKVDGKWWMVDPDGYLFWSYGVVRVTPSSAVTIVDNRENYFSELPDDNAPFSEFYKTRDEFLYRYYKSWGKRTFDFSAANLKLKYGENWREAYRDMVHKRLNSWGMNTISAGSDNGIYRSLPIPYCDRLELNTPRIEGAPANLNVIRDPFHQDFDKDLTQQLLDRKEELQSKWCYGYFIDNKLVWGADHDLGRWVLKSPATQPSKIIFVKNLKSRYGAIEALNRAWTSAYKSWEQLLAAQNEPPQSSIEDCTAFSAILIDAYFKKVKQVMQRIAPGKLYLGCRYVSVNEKVLKIAANYCDVLTFDLFVDSLADLSLPNGIDKPVLIGEFHFGALDRGLFHPGLSPKADQHERGLAYEKYVRSALRHPLIIGTAWHQFSDQATTGRFDGENFQDGLTDVCDRVYSETIMKVRETGNDLYQIRAKEH